MWAVSVKQNNEIVKFGFNEMVDAIEFTSQCLECGDQGTEVSVKEIEED